MKSFPEYIHDPGIVERTLLRVGPSQIKPIEGLLRTPFDEESDLFDIALKSEQESLRKNQPNLARVLDNLRAHYRIPHDASPSINADQFIQEGFIIGCMMASAGYRFLGGGLDKLGDEATGNKMMRSYYGDIQPETLAAIEEMELLEFELFLQNLYDNTEPATQTLRQAISFDLELNRGDEQQENARLVSALTAYALVCHEKRRRRDEYVRAEKERKRHQARLKLGKFTANTPEGVAPETRLRRYYIPFRLSLLQSIPAAIRRDVEDYQREREIWARIKQLRPSRKT